MGTGVVVTHYDSQFEIDTMYTLTYSECESLGWRCLTGLADVNNVPEERSRNILGIIFEVYSQKIREKWPRRTSSVSLQGRSRSKIQRKNEEETKFDSSIVLT
jgi:hypothetical protein